MLASDLGYLTLGGILGALAGAALLAVLRARPAAPRRVRLTMTLGSVPIRPSATTLAGDPFAPDERHVARRGPADMEWQIDQMAVGDGRPAAPRNGTPVRSAAPHDAGVEPRKAAEVTIDPIPPTPADEPTPDEPSQSVGLTVDGGPDPVLAAITAARPVADAGSERASSTGAPVGAPRGDHRMSRTDRQPEDVVGIPVLVERPGTPVGLHETLAGDGVAVLEAAIRARRASAGAESVSGTVATLDRGAPEAGFVVAQADAGGHAGSGGQPERGAADTTGSDSPGPVQAGGSGGSSPSRIEARSRRSGDDSPSGGSGRGPSAGAPDPDDACAEARHTVDERCALAERMRLTADRAADALREAQRTFDVHVAHADAAAAIADARAQRAAKDEAQNTFRTERGRAGSREAVEQAARDWLQEINRINAASREAAATLTREREAATALQPTIERLTVEADAARVQAEGAAESCLIARETLAACEEAVAAARSAKTGTGDDGSAGRTGPDAGIPAPAGHPGWAPAPSAGSGDGSGETEGALAAAMHAGAHPAILRLLTGDRGVMQRLVMAVAEDDPAERRRWQIQLADLVDAIVSRAIENCAFVFPDDHPFWGPFNRTQGRDIALALSSLGFRFDGMGGFADERTPSQRDVSLALGYAGLDPMRVRRWPNEAELAELFRDVTVAADEYILDVAPGLTLGELVGVLGRRADGLTEVWNAWGRIRPILLEDMGS